MPKMEKRGDVENKQGHRKQSPDDRKPAARNQPVNRPCRSPPPDPFAGMSNDEVNSAFYTEQEKATQKYGGQADEYYEEMDNCEFQYDRIAKARVAIVLNETNSPTVDSSFEETSVGPSLDRLFEAAKEPATRDSSSVLERVRSRKYAQSVFKEALALLKDLNNETGENNSVLEVENDNKPVETPAALTDALATFVRDNYPEVLQKFTSGTVPEAIQLEARRLLTPRPDVTMGSNQISSATKVMLDSYGALDETGQNQMWLAACQSANKNLIKGIVELRKNDDNSNGKLAKLVKELLTHAEKAKIDPLKWHTQAQQRRTNFHHWISRIKDVCAMFKETSGIMPKETIVPFKDKACVGNKALYQLILSKIDNHCRDLLRHCNEEGDKALEILFIQCANVTGVDTDHYHQLFVGLRAFHDESATKFIGRFLIARTSAERARNEYTDSKLVSYLLTGLSNHKNNNYQLLISIFREKIMSGGEVSFAELERRFLCIDETISRDVYSSRRSLTSANTARSDRKPKGRRNSKANARCPIFRWRQGYVKVKMFQLWRDGTLRS